MREAHSRKKAEEWLRTLPDTSAIVISDDEETNQSGERGRGLVND